MPRFRFDKTISLVRKTRAFLRIDVGVTRGDLPDDIEDVKKQLNVARRENRRQSRQLERAELQIHQLQAQTHPEGGSKPAREGEGGIKGGSLPDFLILGAEKGGTSFLYRALCQHPLVGAASGKELHFFDTPKWTNRGVGWYRAQFPSSTRKDGRETITGEASPYYLFHPVAPYRASITVPNAKLIATLRNPVNRAYSAYHHRVRAGDEDLGFEEALEAEPVRTSGELERLHSDDRYSGRPYAKYSYLSRGIYVEQLKRWHEHYDPERLLVLKSEDLFTDPAGSLRRVHEFLGLPDHDVDVAATAPRRKKPRYQPMAAQTRERLEKYFEPYNRKLYDYLGVDFGW